MSKICVFFFLALFLISCKDKMEQIKSTENHHENIPLIKILEELESKYCFSGDLEVRIFDDYNEMLEYCLGGISVEELLSKCKNEECRKMFSDNIEKDYPYDLLKDTKVYIVKASLRKECPDNNFCSGEMDMKFAIIDYIKNELIKTRKLERYFGYCSNKKAPR